MARYVFTFAPKTFIRPIVKSVLIFYFGNFQICFNLLIFKTMGQSTFSVSASGSCPKSTVVGRMMLLMFFFVGSFLVAPGSVGAQIEMPNAELTSDGIIQLPVGQPLNATYLIDMSHLSFSSDEEMMAFFASRAGENYFVRAIPHLNKAIVHVQSQKNPNWNVDQWNAHLATETAVRPIKK
jgi:hypothetical protein